MFDWRRCHGMYPQWHEQRRGERFDLERIKQTESLFPIHHSNVRQGRSGGMKCSRLE